MDEIISELLSQLRSKDERIEFLTNQLLGINPSSNNTAAAQEDLRPIGKKRQFKHLIALADKENRAYWEAQAKLAEQEILNAGKNTQAVQIHADGSTQSGNDGTQGSFTFEESSGGVYTQDTSEKEEGV
jgi:hypothetical protein